MKKTKTKNKMAETAEQAGFSTGAETCYCRGTRSMTGVMKNRQSNVLPFPKPPEEPGTSTIICQIGGERFAIHTRVEDLPLAPPPVVMGKRRAKKAPFKILK